MKETIAGLAGTFALLAAGPILGAPKPVVTEPDWLALPTAESVAESYPKIAAALGIEGLSIIGCGVDRSGRLLACTVVDEWPRGLGFGAAGLQMSAQFKMRPQMVDGVPTDGGDVRIPLRFKLPDDPPAPPVTRDGPPAPIDLAKRLIPAQQSLRGFTDPVETMLRELESTPAPGVDDETRKAAVSALRSALPPRLDAVRQVVAKSVSETFTAAELEPIVAFQESKAGVVLESSAPLGIDMDDVNKRLLDDILGELRTAFCETAACGPSADEIQRFESPQSGVAVDRPVWRRVPPPASLRARTPVVAQFMGVSGMVRLTCSVGADAGLRACEPSQESPSGWGFGKAALALASDYRLETVGPVARSVGLTLALRIMFPAPLPPAIAADDGAPENPSARRLLTQLAPPALDPVQVAAISEGLAKTLLASAEPVTRDAVVAAVPIAAARAYQKALRRVSRQLATSLSDDQIRALSTFVDTPSWRTLQARTGELNDRVQSMLGPTMAAWASDARAVFCATHDCTSPPPPQPTPASTAPSTRNP